MRSSRSTPRVLRLPWGIDWWLSAAALLLVPLASGCGQSSSSSIAPLSFSDGGPMDAAGPFDAGGGRCTPEGAERKCTVTLEQTNDGYSCFVGKQTCTGGEWGPCGDGTVVQKGFLNGPPAPGSAPTQRFFSMADAGECSNNPCDPYCQVFNEEPDGGLVSESGTNVDWVEGILEDYGNFPGGLQDKGVTEPCNTASDCQFDQYCQDPGTPTTCASVSGSHSKCTTGAALSATCGDSCVTAVCAARASCCTTAWDADCVQLVASKCGAFCSGTGSCAHNRCLTGGPLASTCDTCVGSICALRPSCCSTAWDASCLAMVGGVCGITCPDPAVPANVGQCIPWAANQSNNSCSKPDLTIGIPCGGEAPICNRGTVAAPAGFRLLAFPANSAHFPSTQTYDPAQDLPSGNFNVCEVTVPIPAGKCVNFGVTDNPACSAVLDNLKEIVINPLGVGHVDECTSDNNWSIFKKESGAAPACAIPSCQTATSTARVPNINLFFMQDRSGSMCEVGCDCNSYGCPQSCTCGTNFATNSRWDLTTSALKTFFKDPASAGLNVALGYYPYNTCGSYCSGTGCDTPAVNFLAPLNAATAAVASNTNCASKTDVQECNLLQSLITVGPTGGTPTYPALAGALNKMKTWAQGHPYDRNIVVLLSDGEPNVCDSNATNLASLASSAYAQAGVVTYTIGVDVPEGAALLQQIATAGHGQFFNVQATQGGGSAGLAAALQTIRTSNISCDLLLDTSIPFDEDTTTVTFTPSAGAAIPLTRRLTAANCTAAGGFYFDDNIDPTKVTLCPSTCTAVKADLTSSLVVKLGCPIIYFPTTTRQVYSATCPPGQKATWKRLTWDSSTPSDSNIKFEARTSDNLADFATAPTAGQLTALATATSVGTPNNQVCSLTGPAPDCPVAIDDKMGPAAGRDHLELWITLNPTASQFVTPTLADWQVTFTCPAQE